MGRVDKLVLDQPLATPHAAYQAKHALRSVPKVSHRTVSTAAQDSEIRKNFQRSLTKQGFKFKLGYNVAKRIVLSGRRCLRLSCSARGAGLGDPEEVPALAAQSGLQAQAGLQGHRRERAVLSQVFLTAP